MTDAELSQEMAGESVESTGMLLRMAVGALLIAAVALLVAVDASWRAGFVWAAGGTAMVALALGELAEMARRNQIEMDGRFLVLSGMALFVLQWAGWAAPGLFPDPWAVAVAVIVVTLGATLWRRVLRGRIEGTLQGASVAVGGLIYVPLLLGFLTAVRLRWGVAGLITVLATCKGGSTAAYLVGKSVGRHRLAPRVSPNKTVEGGVGQVAGSVLVAWGLSFSPWSLMGPRAALGYGAIVAAVAMLGDLSASLLKRQSRLDDSAPLLPGMGGAIDMLDDVLFAAPASYLFLLLLRLAG